MVSGTRVRSVTHHRWPLPLRYQSNRRRRQCGSGCCSRYC